MSTITNDEEGALVAGQMLGRYELLLPIGSGGMGTVWAARLKGTRGFRKLVAVKTILRSSESADSEQMLLREATLASQIHHPNVVETLELGEQDGILYLVMELVSGESLSFMLRETQKLGGIPVPIAINLVGQVCRGLQAAHDLCDEEGQRIGLIHRDISPPNVLVTDSGCVKIVDFGVATTSSSATYGSGEIKGKIAYLAPEQLRGEPLDERVDVFATGILLYLLTTGRHPFRAANEVATIARILSDAPAAAPSSLVEGYPKALEAVVLRAIDKCRDTRFPSALALLEALQRAWPAAFGPRADEAVGAYVRELTGKRAAERRATLRVAEELSETSGSRHSMRSVTAVVAPPRSPSVRAPRAAFRIGVAALCLGLGSAAAAVHVYSNLLEPPRVVPVAVAPAAPNPGERTRSLAANENELSGAVAEPKPVDAPADGDLSAGAQANPAAGMALGSDDADRPIIRVAERPRDGAATEPASTQREDVAGSTSAPADSPLDAVPYLPSELPRLAPATATIPAVAALAPTRAVPPDPPKPRVVTSKLGHALLRIDPNAEAYRVRLPGALERSGQTFRATVRICVAESGAVSNVTVLRSAGAAVDARLQEVLSRWRYRPWIQVGQQTPFCYTFTYEIAQ